MHILELTLEILYELGLWTIAVSIGIFFLGAGVLILIKIIKKRKEIIGGIFAFILMGGLGAFILTGCVDELIRKRRLGFSTLLVLTMVVLGFLVYKTVQHIKKIETPIFKRKKIEEYELPSIIKLNPFLTKLISAIPDFLLSGTFLFAIINQQFDIANRLWLTSIVQIQFLVIHAFLFFAVITFPQINAWSFRLIQVFYFITFFAFYLSASLQLGLEGLLAFLCCTLATFLGFLLHVKSETMMIQSVKRWVISFLGFIIISIITHMPELVNKWHEERNALYFGLLYFVFLGIMEMTTIYYIPWRRKKRINNGN
ncbi:MAG: hypothetical protein A2Y62_19595 [Candidatus Fischerbacteria bacterium RBG_13_37_8]|uniref:Uncharacterized protein n=1 Tax=Candidatus Fischerbacteria bacterium RBG_13_37_8 TaxID=1817863 RepID=A0A1F5VXI1_9BACT|nr:MAG: hypothetical protein A2Y62_19595 [Candidatus Fischerbacteria bacterium RBG_13_37_8]